MRIGELAKRSGCSTRALRHYEEKGLLKAERTLNGYRVYGPDSVKMVEGIRWLIAAGLSTAAVKDILPWLQKESAEQIKCVPLRKKLVREVERMQRQIVALEKSRKMLNKLLGDCLPDSFRIPAS